MQARGSFEVQATQHPPFDTEPGATLGRMTFHKSFEGDLEATSVVEMMYATSAIEGSGVYVALERVRGKLAGKAGTFVLHHTGIRDRGAQSLSVLVVPDSATGELAGLRGTLAIDIVEGRHFYTFDYRFGPS